MLPRGSFEGPVSYCNLFVLSVLDFYCPRRQVVGGAGHLPHGDVFVFCRAGVRRFRPGGDLVAGILVVGPAVCWRALGGGLHVYIHTCIMAGGHNPFRVPAGSSTRASGSPGLVINADDNWQERSGAEGVRSTWRAGVPRYGGGGGGRRRPDQVRHVDATAPQAYGPRGG